MTFCLNGGKAQGDSFTPRNGTVLHAGIIARISGCSGQKEVSLEDQVDHGRDVVREHYGDCPTEYHTIATKGKGERLDRAELAELEALLRKRILDVLIAEDLGRIVRGHEAVRLCGIARDHQTRVIAPNDFVDTGNRHGRKMRRRLAATTSATIRTRPNA